MGEGEEREEKKEEMETQAKDRRLVIFEKVQEEKKGETEIKSSESESDKKDLNDDVLKNQSEDVVSDVGEIRKEAERLKEDVKGKGVEADPVPEQADPAYYEIQKDSSSSEDRTTLSDFMFKKRSTEEGPSDATLSKQEVEDWKFAAEKAVEMGLTVEATYEMIQEEKLERERKAKLSQETENDPQLAKSMQEAYQKDTEEEKELKIGSGRTTSKKRKSVVIHTKPSEKLKDVKQSIAAHNQWEAHHKTRVTDRIHKRRFKELITGVQLKRKRGQSVPCIRIARAGFNTYNETCDLGNLYELGYTEWVELHNIIFRSTGIHKQTVLDALEKKFDIIKKFKIDIKGLPTPDYYEMEDEDPSIEPLQRKKRKVGSVAPRGVHGDFVKNLNTTEFLGQLSTDNLETLLENLDLSLPSGVENPRNGLFIKEPEHGMFFTSARGKLSFQRTAELDKVPHMHLFTLYRFCQAFSDRGNGYEQILIDEGWRRKMDVTIAPSFEVKKEVVELLGN